MSLGYGLSCEENWFLIYFASDPGVGNGADQRRVEEEWCAVPPIGKVFNQRDRAVSVVVAQMNGRQK